MPSPIAKRVAVPMNSKSPLNDDVLSRIRPVTHTHASIRMSLYGRPKTGKTRLACTFPKPLLVIGSEDGTASVVGIKGVDFVLLKKCEEVSTVIDGPLAVGRYASAVFDNGTKFRDMRIAEILGLDRLPLQKGWGFATIKQWGECANSIKQLLRPLFELARCGSLNLVFIAQESELSGFGENDDKPDEQKIKSQNVEDMAFIPEIGPAMGKSVRDWINAECDYIGQTLIRNQVVARQVTAIKGQPPSTSYEATGKAEYCLRVNPNGIYQAGFRVPIGREIKQDFVTDPSYDKIVRLIEGKPLTEDK